MPVEKLEMPIVRGRIKIFHKDNPEIVIFEEDNVIVNTVKSLFSRLMLDSVEPKYGIWGLAIGSGDSGWDDNPPAPTTTQTRLLNEIKRKQATARRYVDRNALNPVTLPSEAIEIQTLFNATDDNITDFIREMGLIGGGSTADNTNMNTADYWDPNILDVNTVTLINYKTLGELRLPAGIDIIFSWVLFF